MEPKVPAVTGGAERDTVSQPLGSRAWDVGERTSLRPVEEKRHF